MMKPVRLGRAGLYALVSPSDDADLGMYLIEIRIPLYLWIKSGLVNCLIYDEIHLCDSIEQAIEECEQVIEGITLKARQN